MNLNSLNPPVETILYNINLPSFIHNYKQQIINLIVPYLLQIKQFINSQNNQSTVSPLILIVAIIVVGYIMVAIFSGLFGKRQFGGSHSMRQSSELISQINDLKKQLKSLKTSFAQLMKDASSSSRSQNELILNNQNTTNINQQNQLWSQILPLYINSLENNKKLVNYVLQSQFQMLKQLKKFKKLQRSSLSSGRPSTSTVRSKISDKKLQSSIPSSKSPLKNTSTLSSIKKTQIKSSQRPIRSQIIDKAQNKADDAFLLPAENTQVQITSKIKQKTPEKNMFEKSFVNKNSVLPDIQIKQQNKLIDKNSHTSTVNIENKTQIHQTVKQTTISQIIQNQNDDQVIVQTKIQQKTSHVDLVTVNPTNQFEQVQIGQLQYNEEGTEEPHQFIPPPKLPVIKKVNPPKPGTKRPPPPPPKK